MAIMDAPTEVDVFDRAIVWDQHGCLPLSRAADVEDLEVYRRAGLDFVSINVGFDAMSWSETLGVLMHLREQIIDRPDSLVLVDRADDIREAKQSGRLGVAFDLEGAVALDDRVEMVETYYRLGVRTLLIAYNLPNSAGGGCHGADIGLSDFGREVVAEMNRVGMVVDGTHCSRRTTMDLFELSTAPVVFSHSVPSGVKDHPRNIDDDQMRACAATGGVVGINGVGIFLGDNTTSTDDLFRAVDYAVDVVGPAHVGIGLDYTFDREELAAFVEENSAVYPSGDGYGDGTSPVAPIEFVHPAQLRELSAMMLEHGYGDDAVQAILGGNFLRVAEQVWT